MITIIELLAHNYKKIGTHPLQENGEYDIEVSDKTTDEVLYTLKSVSKAEWDLNFMVIRLYDEESLNEAQCEHLLTAIENYGQEKYNKGGNDDY